MRNDFPMMVFGTNIDLILHYFKNSAVLMHDLFGASTLYLDPAYMTETEPLNL